MAKRLTEANSSYLRAHGNDDVDWREWGTDAFDEAASRDIPVLVSVGYLGNKQCAVMADESFRDASVASVVNKNFVPVLVDAIERPDIAQLMADAASSLTGQTGWPLTVFLTPAGQPFFGGTYYPTVMAGNQPGFLELCLTMAQAWAQQRDEAVASGAQIVEKLQKIDEQPVEHPRPVSRLLLTSTRNKMDQNNGGFGGGAKTFQAPMIDALMVSGDANQLEAAQLTVEHWIRGGVHDIISGGFYHGSTDAAWEKPSPEKTLYDNALLLGTLTRVWRKIGEDKSELRGAIEAAVRGLVGWLLQDMKIETSLGLAFAAGQISGSRDEAIIACWNGLLADSLAQAAIAFNEPTWLVLARRVIDYLWAAHGFCAATPVRISRDGKPGAAPAILEDYAGFVLGAASVADALGKEDGAANQMGRAQYVECALDVLRLATDQFTDEDGGFCDALASEILPARVRRLADNELPSPTSMMVRALRQVSRLTKDEQWNERADKAERTLWPAMAGAPLTSGWGLADLAGEAQVSLPRLDNDAIGDPQKALDMLASLPNAADRGVPIFEWRELPRGHYEIGIKESDQVVEAVLDGTKTTRAMLLSELECQGIELNTLHGRYELVTDSTDFPVAITRVNKVRVVSLAEVDEQHVRGEAEGFTGLAQWRAAHEKHWRNAGLGEVSDATQVVLLRFRTYRSGDIVGGKVIDFSV